MSDTPTEISTPVGRLVMGDAYNPQTTDNEGNPLVVKSGPNIGQPRVNYYMAIAIPKTDTGYDALWAKIRGVARGSFPNLFDASGNCIQPTFAFKITDGDSQIPNGRGNKPCDREGFPGHWILHFSNGFAPKCYKYENGKHVELTEQVIKRGFYIQIYGTIKSNNSVQKPGIYLNVSMVNFVAYGDEIRSGPNADTAFGNTPVALPAGASMTPLAPATPMAAPAPAAPMTAPAPGAVAPAPTPGAVAPAPTILIPQGATLFYVIGDATYTAEQLKGQGWNDDQIAQLPTTDIPF